MAINRNVQKHSGSFVGAHFSGRTSNETRSPLYTHNGKPPKDPSILRTECERRQQGAGRRDRDL
eukprot:4964383-Pleurochrysis_carterae.AAC.1